jgi:bacillithiol biosynthesis cysteine-adding enzyme BshC
VFSQSGLSATATRIPVDIRSFPWIRRLAADYAFAYGNVGDFFAGNPSDQAAWREAIGRVTQGPRPQRNRISDILHAQQMRRGAPAEAVSAAARLRDPSSVAIVTGQQAGLFGGPLFTLLKAVTALRLAEGVTQEHGVPAIPIFWIDAEDHDWDEVKGCGLIDADLSLVRIALGDPEGANQQPVGRVRLDDSVRKAIDDLVAALPQTEVTPVLLEQIREAYRPGTGMSEAFARWVESVLGPKGLVVYDSSDPAAKPLLADLFAEEVSHPGRTSQLAADAGARLEALGYHAQATPSEGNIALFHTDGGRVPIRQQDGRFVIGERSLSQADLLDEVRMRPEDYSPNVLLRPLAQDTLFPTVCYIAGPNELAYLAQLRGVYDAFGIPMPLIYQRATATILDSNAMRFLSRHVFPLEALRAQDEGALNQLLAAQLPGSVEASLEDATRVVNERMEALAAAVPQIDPTLEGATRSTASRMQDDLKKLQGKIIQAAKRKDETLRRQFQRAQAQAFPGGQPQERAIGFIYFLNKYGPVLVDRLWDDLTLDMGTHWVISI